MRVLEAPTRVTFPLEANSDGGTEFSTRRGGPLDEAHCRVDDWENTVGRSTHVAATIDQQNTVAHIWMWGEELTGLMTGRTRWGHAAATVDRHNTNNVVTCYMSTSRGLSHRRGLTIYPRPQPRHLHSHRSGPARPHTERVRTPHSSRDRDEGLDALDL